MDGQLIDSYSRRIDYLRLSVTDRCNLRCTYCMPSKGIKLLEKDQLLTLEEIIKAVSILSQLGIKKVRLTGGEPLVRENILELIEGIKNISQIEDVSITTNGILLNKFLKDIYRLGIKRINISIDSLDKKKYTQITRGGELSRVLEAVDNAIEMGFRSIKINTVITQKFDLDDAQRFIELATAKPVSVRFIEMMNIPGTDVECSRSTIGVQKPGVSIEDIYKYINGQDRYYPIKEPLGFGPAVYYASDESKGNIGFIVNSKDYCSFCNRIRLTSKGALKLCLFSEVELDIKKELRQGTGSERIKKMIAGYIKNKPQNRNGNSCFINGRELKIPGFMNKIGG